MQTRTDIHRPSAIVPEDYKFVAFDHVKIESFGDCAMAQMERERLKAHMEITGGIFDRTNHGGNCYICGSVNAQYTVAFYHRASNVYIRTGQDCAAKLEMSYGDFNRFREGIRNHVHAIAGKKKASAILDEAGLTECMTIRNADWVANDPAENPKRIIRDIVDKLVKYGSISDRSMDYLGKLLSDVRRAPEIAKEREIERERAGAIPEGRWTFSGEIATVKQPDFDSAFPAVKLLVKLECGQKVWVTCPSCIDPKKGDVVEMTATIKRSDRDESFGFASRPSKARILNQSN